MKNDNLDKTSKQTVKLDKTSEQAVKLGKECII